MLPAMTILTSLDALRALYDPVRERSAKKEIRSSTRTRAVSSAFRPFW
jgi:hypothetical protein